MGIEDWLGGRLQVRLVSADTMELLTSLNREGICITDVVTEDALTTRFVLRRRDYNTARTICEKRGGKIDIIGKSGIFWAVGQLLHRPILVMGILVWICMLLYLPTRVFFAEVEGNLQIPDRQILAAAEECGIRFGVSGREIRSERIKNALLEKIPQLQWVGINTRGCIAVISVREKQMDLPEETRPPVSSIVAVTDGFILSATATRGSLLCQPGQTVQRGQVLISGYTDCGISIRAGRAEGEIYAQTQHPVRVVSMGMCLERGQIKTQRSHYSLLIGKNRINFRKDSGNIGSTCVRMYTDYYIILPGGFRLPLGIGRETVYDCDTVPVLVEAEDAMTRFAGEYLLSQFLSGSILDRDLTFRREGDTCVLEGIYFCKEMIGRQKAEEIGELHE